MSKFPALNPTVRGWLLDGSLAAYVPAYVARLHQGSYSRRYFNRKLAAVGHFAHWMSLCRLRADRLDESHIDQFLHEHLPHCDCAPRVMCARGDTRAALTHLLSLLRQQAVVAPVPVPTGPIVDELERYSAHMRDARGLVAGTLKTRLRIVRRLLSSKFAGRALRFDQLTPKDIRGFIAEQLELRTTVNNAVAINSALRDYLRWRSTCGDAVQPLLGVIASPARWRMTSLPRSLTPEQVECVLSACAASRRSPKRGLAVIRLALDLGLRVAEIHRLQLGDIDWDLGTVTLNGTKSRRQDVLPLPRLTGHALADYIRHERPRGSDRAVFVRHLAPHDQPIGRAAIRGIVKRVFQQAGIAHTRSHALRHTLACRLVDGGSPIKEVADILRHRSLDTTQIYAKVNHGALAEVVMPWPGSAA